MKTVLIIIRESSGLIAFLIFGSMAVFYLCYRLAFKKESGQRESLFSQDEIDLLCRVDNLFQGVPLHNGHEWKDLHVNDLIAICVEASEIVGKNDERRVKRFLIQTAERAEDLSSWMKTNATRDFYKGSDMSYLIEKPGILAFSLRSRAGKIP